MKTISPIQTWVNGKSVNATIFNLYVIGGTLGSSASFYYSLLDDSLAQVSQGNLTMSGEACKISVLVNEPELATDAEIVNPRTPFKSAFEGKGIVKVLY